MGLQINVGKGKALVVKKDQRGVMRRRGRVGKKCKR